MDWGIYHLPGQPVPNLEESKGWVLGPVQRPVFLLIPHGTSLLCAQAGPGAWPVPLCLSPQTMWVCVDPQGETQWLILLTNPAEIQQQLSLSHPCSGECHFPSRHFSDNAIVFSYVSMLTNTYVFKGYHSNKVGVLHNSKPEVQLIRRGKCRVATFTALTSPGIISLVGKRGKEEWHDLTVAVTDMVGKIQA